MTVLALLLLTIGVADLVRSRDVASPGSDPPHPRTVTPLPEPERRGLDDPVVRLRLAAACVGAPVATVLGWGAGLSVWWIVAIVAASLAWLALTPAGWGGRRTGLWPVVGLAAAVVAVLALGDAIPRADGWLTRWYAGLGLGALEDVTFERFAVAAGYVVFLVTSANIIVRTALAGAHVPVADTERRLKGGRVLGPIERVFIFATAVSGELVALAAIVAAKGIVRFPELQRDDRGNKAEYVLVGSFVSWAVALVLVPLFA